jgi:PII-like signaling protein
MRVPVDAILLRVFVGEEDRYEGRSLYQAIVATALERRMAGATVLPGPDGFGVSRSVRTELNVDAGPRSPMVVEIVDTEAQINDFLPVINEVIESGLVTMEKVRAIRYRRPDGLDPSNGRGSTAVA